MQYGMTFVLDMMDFERNEEKHVLTMPGDYIRMSEWAEKNIEGCTETVSSLRRNYATAWFALKRRGMLEKLGLPETLDLEAVDAMADRFSIFVNEFDGVLPLERGRKE